jgi:hypothetical protein
MLNPDQPPVNFMNNFQAPGKAFSISGRKCRSSKHAVSHTALTNSGPKFNCAIKKYSRYIFYVLFQVERFSRGPWWKKPTVVMRSPLSRTVHPANRFAGEEEQYLQAVSSASQADLPLQDLPDPYRKVNIKFS